MRLRRGKRGDPPRAVIGVVGVEEEPPPIFGGTRFLEYRCARGELLGEILAFWFASSKIVAATRSSSLRDLLRFCLRGCASALGSSGSARVRSSFNAFVSHFPGGTEDVKNIVRLCSSIRYCCMDGPAALRKGMGGDGLSGLISPVGEVTTVMGLERELIMMMPFQRSW